MIWLVAVLGALGALRAYHAVSIGAYWLPDYELYTAGGLGLYPSPLGRLLGVFGPVPFEIAHVVAAGALPVVVALVAYRRGRSPLLAGVLVSVLPLAFMGAYVSVDLMAVTVLAGSLLCGWGGRLLLCLVAVMLHLALLPFAVVALAELGRRYWLPIGFFLGVPALVSFWLTPYFGVWENIGTVGFYVGLIGTTAVALLLSGAIAFPWLHDRAIVLAWACAAGADAGLQGHIHVRYALPVLVVAAVSLGRRRRFDARAWHLHRYAEARPEGSVT